MSDLVENPEDRFSHNEAQVEVGETHAVMGCCIKGVGDMVKRDFK